MKNNHKHILFSNNLLNIVNKQIVDFMNNQVSNVNFFVIDKFGNHIYKNCALKKNCRRY